MLRSFASYILRGRSHAILVATSTAILALLLPLLSHLSGATIALVTLRKRLPEGLLVLCGAGLILAVIGYFSSISFPMVRAFLVSTLLVVWLPVVCAAEVLRRWRSLGAALSTAAVYGVLAMLILYLSVDDVGQWWRTMLDNVLTPLLEGAPVPLSAADKARLLTSLSGVMTGFMAAAIVYSTMINLFIGRWLQAMLYNPGGFASEFQALRLGRGMAVAAGIVLLLSSVTSGGGSHFLVNLVILVVAVYSFHGLALVHALVAAMHARKAWLYGLYILMLFVLPQVLMVLSAAGFADSWIDFRARLRHRNGR